MSAVSWVLTSWLLSLVPLFKNVLRPLERSRPDLWRGLRRLRYRLTHRVVTQHVRAYDPAAARTWKFGVNLVGYVQSEKGTGESARTALRALEAVGVPCVANNLVDSGSLNLHPQSWVQHNPYRINLLRVNPDQACIAAHQLGARYFRGRYSIGYWAWELPDFPQEWRASAEHLHEIWVPSAFVREAVSKVVEIPVIRIPHAVSVETDTQGPAASNGRGGDHAAFRFLCVFDFMSYWQRKNPFGVVEAFRRAFPEQDGVELVIKTMHGSCIPSIVHRLRQVTHGTAIQVIDGVWTRERVNRLLNESDCVISLHQAEGFGLVLAEAMALGKPVIATGYSGNTDFMTAENSLPVHYRLTVLEEDVGPYLRGNRWAEPDLDHAAAHMRWVVAHPEAAHALGRRAVQTIQEGFSPTVVGTLMAERLHVALGTHAGDHETVRST